MSQFEQGPDDELTDVVERLRRGRVEASASELDRLKLRAMAQAAPSRRKGAPLKTRSIAALLTVALMAAGTGGVIASSGGGGGGNSGDSQYKPGCGPPPDGINPSGTHTGPPGQGDTNRESCPVVPASLP
jgi:hypothetical protein